MFFFFKDGTSVSQLQVKGKYDCGLLGKSYRETL